MGLLTDIGIKDASVYSTSLALYFVSGQSRRSLTPSCADRFHTSSQIGYCVFEVPANMM